MLKHIVLATSRLFRSASANSGQSNKHRNVLRLLGALVLLGAAQFAHAGTEFCSSYPTYGTQFHIIDGNDPSLTPANLPSSITIDQSCYFKNFPISSKWPDGLTSTLNFKQYPYPTLAVFENVYYSGNMACSNTDTKIWFVNNAYYAANNQCQTLFIPVETIGKTTPGPTATVGVPFTYTLTIPVMYDPATNTYYNNPSQDNLINATVYDDLTATGVDMTYVSNTAYTIDEFGGITPIPGGLVPYVGTVTIGTETYTGDSTHLLFRYQENSALTSIPKQTQVVVKLTVMLNDNTAVNVAGTQFINTAKWWFGRNIDGVDYAPLPGQSGVSAPMTIAEPNLIMTKTASVTNLNVGSNATYTLNVQNSGGGDAWHATITDNIPTGMCNYDPTTGPITAQILSSTGTVISTLTQGTDYSVSWGSYTTGSFSCQLIFNMLTSTAVIGPSQHLVITYQDQLDAGIGSGSYTNVAGATQWYNDSSDTISHPKTLSADGTPSIVDYQDAYTVTAATAGYYFLKSAQNLTTGQVEDAVTGLSAFPGDTIRYTLQIQNFNIPQLDNITVTDDLGAENTSAVFQTGTLTLASTDLPGGSYTLNSTGGTNGAGTVTINNLSLASNTQYYISFDVKLANSLTNGIIVYNQASLSGTQGTVTHSGLSDDPFINGTKLLDDNTIKDRTPVTIQTPGDLSKSNPAKTTATIGEQFVYQIKVPATPVNVPLYDVKIYDLLPSSAARMSFVSASVVSGGSWSLVNTNTASSPVIEDQSTGIDIPAGGQAVINVTVKLDNNATNVSGLNFTNTAYYTYDKVNGDNTSEGTTGSVSTTNMTVVEPSLTANKTVAYSSPVSKAITSPANVGDVLQYTVTIPNNGTSEAYDVDVLDFLPANLTLVAGSATAKIGGVPVNGFISDPTILASGALVWGFQNGDSTLDIPVGKSLVITYRATVAAANGGSISNSVYVDWSSLDNSITGERTGDGCPTVTSPNTYCYGPVSTSVSATDPTALTKSVVSDSWTTFSSNANDSTVRVGDTVDYELQLTLREGTTDNVVVTDALPTGLAFDSPISISPASATPGTSSNPFTYTVSSQPGNGDTGTITWNLGSVDNLVDNDLTNNTLTIRFRVKVLNNTLSQTPVAQLLTNNATLNYSIAGVAATPKTASASINVWQPLLTISKTAAPAGGDSIIDPSISENVTYTISIQNTGNTPAYDTYLIDNLPVGLQSGFTMDSITITDGTNTTTPANFVTSYTSGVATWDFSNGGTNAYVIPPGYTMYVVYTVTSDNTLGAGLTLTNTAQVQHYYSFGIADPLPTADRQDYGATGTASTTLTTASAQALTKLALVSTAAIGQPFTYRITIPAPASLYNVQVLDDIGLTATGVSLGFVSASAHLTSNAKTWANLTNIGSAANLVLVDNANGGLDVPAGDPLVVDVTLVLKDDTTNNTTGKSFTNTANYNYNSSDTSTTYVPGAPGASGPVTIAAPNLIMTKNGPASMYLGAPGSFSLSVLNTGLADAWHAVITDKLPYVTSSPSWGMCATAPTITSIGIYNSSNVLQRSLTAGTDYSVVYTAAPTCEYTISLLSAAARITAGDHLLINYDTNLDPGTASNLPLTNIAGATQYLSADPGVAGATVNVHTFNNTLTDGTPTVTDFQDAFTVTTASPTLTFTKEVYDVTTSSIGTTASPGDVLQYTLTINNTGSIDALNFSLTDDLDNLNATAMFVANSLNVTSIPAGAVDASNKTGGSKGTGYISISNLSVAAGGTITIVYTVQLVPVIDSGTVVLNQGQIAATTITTQLSDDPNTATADDPTHTTISSAPKYQIYKTSSDLTGSSIILLAGDTLRYTITVNNIGNENAVSAVLKDQIPANTTYVSGSTTLNGNPVADPATGVSALQNGLLIYSSSDTTPGHLPADASKNASNTATITFDVTINAGVFSGTVISNQAYLNATGAGSGTVVDQPSDDPNTTVLNDPTLNVIGNVPLIDAVKTVSLYTDLAPANGAADAGDTLLYTITVTNYGKVQATGVVLTDKIPTNTTYVAGSTTLNGLAVTDPSAGVSALESGMPVSSSDLTPPVPAVGYLSPGATATITFKVTINSGVGSGVTISNQGFVTSNEQAVEPTDADGNDSNGDQPTIIVTGYPQQLMITKQVNIVGGGVATSGGQVEYVVTVTNVGQVAASNVLITDNLDDITPGYLMYVNGSAMLNGSTLGISYSSPQLTADYSATYGLLQPGQTAVLRFRANISNGLAIGTTVTNLARAYWNLMTQTDSAMVSFAIGGTPGSGSLSGQVWHDDNYNNTYDSGELNLANWDIQVWFKGKLLGTVQSDVTGNYTITGLPANYSAATTVDPYELRFYAPGAGANTAKLGKADSSYSNGMYAPFTDDLQKISNIVFKSGENVSNLNLPIDPNGVIYDSIVRSPVAGATVTLLSASTNTPVSSSCFDDPVQQNQVTTANGYYKFDLNFGNTGCSATPGGDYLISVTAPVTGYVSGESVAIPAQTNASTAAFSVPGCIGTLNDAVPATTTTCEVQPFTTAPAATYSPGTTQTKYYLKLTLNNPQPGSSQIFNNPIPIDPDLSSALAVSKVSPKVNVTRGELVPYTITIRNTLIVALTNVTIHDLFPAGFKYVKGSARVNDVATEPTINGLDLSWNTTVPALTTYTIKLLLIVGSGVQDNDYVNRAYIYSNVTNSNASGVAEATVHVVPDPTFDCSDIVGKVFDDKNFNGHQDKNEMGIAGVRLATVRGLLVTTDKYGRFHLTCAAVPDEQRGSNFILKLDEHSLPTGFRMTTENPRVQRLTRGKALNFNFGATLHHVVTLDLADGVFEHDSDKMRSQWVPRLGLLIEQLRKSPSVLRLTYLADVESRSVVNDRIDAMKQRIMSKWDQVGSYPLTIETEIFWRHGGPVDKGGLSQ